MDYNVTYQELADELSRLGHSKVFTAVALQLSDQPHKYEVKRWVSYVVPVIKHWTPWTNPSGLLDYDYGTWRIVQIEQNPAQFMDMLNSWIKNDNHLLMDNVWIRLTVDRWERQRTWSHQGDNNRRQIPYPTLWYRPSNQYEQLQPDYDLVAPNLPYFPTTNEAFASLIDGVDLRFITNRSLEGSRFNVFILDDNPFIEKASLHMNKCDIVVGGTDTTGCELKVFDDFNTEFIQSIDHTGQYSVNWSGIPGYAVFVLTRNFELLDKVIYSRNHSSELIVMSK